MKQLWGMIKKENKVLFRNWVLYLSTLILPILMLAINYYMHNKSVMSINVGIVSENNMLIEVLENYPTEEVEFDYIQFENINQAETAFMKEEIDIYIDSLDNSKIKFYLDYNSTKGQVAYQYLSNSIQKEVSNDLLNNHSELMRQISKAQIYKISLAEHVEKNTTTQKSYSLIMVGAMWIFLFTPLNQAIYQITQEKRSKTMFLLYKAPVKGIKLYISKMSAVIIQFTLSWILYFFALYKLELLDINYSFKNILIFYLIVITMSSLGYFISMLFSNDGIISIISLIFTIPIIFLNSLGNNDFDNFLRVLPTYYCGQLLVDVVKNVDVSLINVAICFTNIIISTVLTIVIFKKSDCVKLCTFID